MKAAVQAIAFVVAFPSVLLADEAVGTITVFLDGERRTWHTILMQQGERDVFTATMQQRGSATEVQLQGHPIPSFTSKEVLSIDLQFFGRDAPIGEPDAIDILYTPNGLSGPLWTSRGAPERPRLKVTVFDVWGNVGQFHAVVSGQICKRPRLFSQTDTSNCTQLSGSIETQLLVK